MILYKYKYKLRTVLSTNVYNTLIISSKYNENVNGKNVKSMQSKEKPKYTISYTIQWRNFGIGCPWLLTIGCPPPLKKTGPEVVSTLFFWFLRGYTRILCRKTLIKYDRRPWRATMSDGQRKVLKIWTLFIVGNEVFPLQIFNITVLPNNEDK